MSASCSGCFTYQQGFWTVNGTGQVVAGGAAQNYGSVTTALTQPVVGMTTPPSGLGYWLVARDGGTFTFNVPFDGGGNQHETCSCFVGIAAHYTAGGYWALDQYGH